MESQGIHGTGSTKYTTFQYEWIIRLIRLCSERNVQVTVARLHKATGFSGQCIRAIMREADGTDLLLGGNGNGYMIATNQEEANRLTQRLQHQVEEMQIRIARRIAHGSVPKTT